MIFTPPKKKRFKDPISFAEKSDFPSSNSTEAFSSVAGSPLTSLGKKSGRNFFSERSQKKKILQKKLKKDWSVDEYWETVALFISKRILKRNLNQDITKFFSNRTKSQIRSLFIRKKEQYEDFLNLFFEFYSDDSEFQADDEEKLLCLVRKLMSEEKFVAFLKSRIKKGENFIFDKLYYNYVFEEMKDINDEQKPTTKIEIASSLFGKLQSFNENMQRGSGTGSREDKKPSEVTLDEDFLVNYAKSMFHFSS